MKFRFQDGDEVALRADRHWFLPAGSRGIVFCQYATDPPAYEVNFQDVRGKIFGAVVEEDEIEVLHEKAVLPIFEAVKTA